MLTTLEIQGQNADRVIKEKTYDHLFILQKAVVIPMTCVKGTR